MEAKQTCVFTLNDFGPAGGEPPLAAGRAVSLPAAGTPPIGSQDELDRALAAVAAPGEVETLQIIFDYNKPIARSDWLDQRGMIPDDLHDAAYKDASARYSLAALHAFSRIRALDVSTSDGCCHPVAVAIPRNVWSRLSTVGGDWAHFQITDACPETVPLLEARGQ